MGEVIDLSRERALRGSKSELEDCVECFAQTKVRKDETIDERPNYIRGSGQLCVSCYGDNFLATKQFAEVLNSTGYK